MTANPHRKHVRFTLAAALALGATAAIASTQAPQGSGAEPPIVLAQAAPASGAAPAVDPAAGHPPLEAGVRRAAAEGPDALRRYVFRTRMIYNWYMPSFMPQE